MNRHAFVWTLVLSLTSATAAAQYCPSYTPANSNCGLQPVAGINPSISRWNELFRLVTPGPSGWGADGPTVGTMRQGCAVPLQVPPRVPCVIFKAALMHESGWHHFCKPTAPSAAIGASSRTIVSFDCGYGVSQITSGMREGETAPFSRTRVVNDPRYNLQVGLKFITEKWDLVSCVGTRQVDIAEHWYSALWAYNGLSYINNPNNPNKRAGRGVYVHAQNSGSSSRWTYSERVFGHAEFPPDARYWSPVALAYPNRADVGTSSSPRAMAQPACASPTSCTARRSVHTGNCDGATPVGDAGAPRGDAGDASTSQTESDAGDDSVDVDISPEQLERPGEDDAGAPPEGQNASSNGNSCLCHASEPARPWPWAAALIALYIVSTRRRRATV